MVIQRRKYWGLIAALCLIVVFGGSQLAVAAPAAPANQANATLSEDFWCDVPTGTACDAIKNNSNFLRLQTSLGAATSVGVTRWSLSSIPWAIGDARLNLAYAYAGSCAPASTLTMSVYSATATDPVSRGSLLESITAQVPNPEPNSLSEAYQHWTDSTPADGLVQYLEAQRVAGQPATLWIETTQATGSVFLTASNNPAGADTTCGTGNVGATYPLLGPVLQLADGPQPLAVSVSSAVAQPQAVTWPLYAGLGALALIVVAGVLVSRRKTA